MTTTNHVVVRFIKPAGSKQPGQLATLNRGAADYLIAQGIVVPIERRDRRESSAKATTTAS